MPIKARVDSLDGIEEPQQALYKPLDPEDKSKGYVLDVEPVGDLALEDVGGLKRALETQTNQRKEAKQQLERWEQIGLPQDQIIAGLKELETLRKFDPDKEAEKLAEQKAKARIDEIQNKATEQLTAKEQRIAKVTGFIEKRVRTDVAERLLKEAGGEPELLMPIIERETRVRWTEEDIPIVEVLNKDGAPRIKDAQSGALMGIGDLIEEMKKRPSLAGAFEGSQAKGSGADPSASRGDAGASGNLGAPRHRGDFKDAMARSKWIREHGTDAYLNLPVQPKEGKSAA